MNGAVGVKCLFLPVLFYGIGSLLFIRTKKEKKEQPKRWEWAVIILLLSGAALIAVQLPAGKINLQESPVKSVPQRSAETGGISALHKRARFAGRHIGCLEQE